MIPWSKLGPGLLWAAAAIGVSHLVQSTRAGATAGFGLISVVVLALILKYPFFEFGGRYAAATGDSLVEGYRRIGTWALWVFLLVMVVSATISQVAIVLFTAFLVQFVFGLQSPVALVASALMLAGIALLWFGRYRALDLTIKLILIVLTVSTLVAAVVSAPRADLSTGLVWPWHVVGSIVPFAFLLALVGWMPSPVDTSVWSSLWTLAKDEDRGERTSVREARLDFGVGYVGTSILAIAFLTLGAGVMYGSSVPFSPQGTVFSTQLVELYESTLGAWARPIVLAAVVTTMLSTTLTVMDGYPRAIERTVQNLTSRSSVAEGVGGDVGRIYWACIAALACLTVLILQLFIGTLTTMVDFATIVAFLTAPLLGYLNLRAVTSAEMPVEYRPGPGMKALSWIGLILLGGTGAVYLISFLM